jgi:hypothetical protein
MAKKTRVKVRGWNLTKFYQLGDIADLVINHVIRRR